MNINLLIPEETASEVKADVENAIREELGANMGYLVEDDSRGLGANYEVAALIIGIANIPSAISPDPVYQQDGNVRLPGLDNHAMGTIFEELIRRFNEESNEEAGEHFTPRDVIRLMANLIFLPIADDIRDATYRVYDGACGTGGMLSVAEETLEYLASDHGKDVSGAFS